MNLDQLKTECNPIIYPVISSFYTSGPNSLQFINLQKHGHMLLSEVDRFSLAELKSYLAICSDCKGVFSSIQMEKCPVTCSVHTCRIPVRFVAEEEWTRKIPVQFVVLGRKERGYNEGIYVDKKSGVGLQIECRLNRYPVAFIVTKSTGANIVKEETKMEIFSDLNSEEIIVYYRIAKEMLVPVRYVTCGDSDRIRFNIEYVPMKGKAILRAWAIDGTCELSNVQVSGAAFRDLLSVGVDHEKLLLSDLMYAIKHDGVSKEIVFTYTAIENKAVVPHSSVITSKSVPIIYISSKYCHKEANFDVHRVGVSSRIRVYGGVSGGCVFDRGYCSSGRGNDTVDAMNIVGGSLDYIFGFTGDESHVIFDVIHDGVSDEIIVTYNTRRD